MIKVIHILHSVGGVDTSLRMITEHIDPSKFENVVIHGKKDNSNFLDKNKNKIKEYQLDIERNISPIKDLKSIFGAWKIIKSERPNILHVHSAKGGIIGNVLGFVLKNVIVLHTPQAYSFLSTQNIFKKKLFILIERIVKNKKSILLASSNSEKQRGINEIKYKMDKVRLFNNSIKPIVLNQDYADISKYKLPIKYICTVGRPSYQKNIEMMIEVLKEIKKEIPNIHLVIMGVGVVSPNTENVKELIKQHDLEDNTTMIEWIEREKIFHIIDKSMLYISTARYEGLPYAIIESLSLSKSIVATNCDGNRDLVIDGVNGFLLDSDDIGLMSAKTIEIIRNDSKRIDFEKKSLQIFNKDFNLYKNILDLEMIYSEYSMD